MPGAIRTNYDIGDNDVIDWQGHTPHYVEYKTSQATIAPGHLVREIGTTDMSIALQSLALAQQLVGFVLYKETNSKYQKADVTSTYASGAWVAVAPLSQTYAIKTISGTFTATHQQCGPDGTTDGAVSKIAVGTVERHKVGYNLTVNASGAGGSLIVQVGN